MQTIPTRKPPTKAEEDDFETPEVRMGFGGTYGHPPEIGKHRHEFGPIPGCEPYFKKGKLDVGYVTLICVCGDTKEVIVIDRR